MKKKYYDDLKRIFLYLNKKFFPNLEREKSFDEFLKFVTTVSGPNNLLSIRNDKYRLVVANIFTKGVRKIIIRVLSKESNYWSEEFHLLSSTWIQVLDNVSDIIIHDIKELDNEI